MSEHTDFESKLRLLADERNSRLLGFSASISAYGVAAIRGVLVLNGSAALAVLTKQGSITAEGRGVIWLCAVGACLAVLCAGTSFLAQWCRKESFLEATLQGIYMFQHTGRSLSLGNVPYVWRARLCAGVSAALFCASVFCFFMAVQKLLPII
jgi:hypothetical protein